MRTNYDSLTIGVRIRRLLDEKHISARRVAQAIEMPPSTFANMLTSRKDRDYGVGLLADIARAMGVTVEEISGRATVTRFLGAVGDEVVQTRLGRSHESPGTHRQREGVDLERPPRLHSESRNVGLERDILIIMKNLSVLSHKTDELHEWHKPEDDHGEKIWYVRRELETAIQELTASNQHQNKLLRDMTASYDKTIKLLTVEIVKLREELERRSGE